MSLPYSNSLNFTNLNEGPFPSKRSLFPIWIKAIWGYLPLLTIIPVRCNLPRIIPSPYILRIKLFGVWGIMSSNWPSSMVMSWWFCFNSPQFTQFTIVKHHLNLNIMSQSFGGGSKWLMIKLLLYSSLLLSISGMVARKKVLPRQVHQAYPRTDARWCRVSDLLWRLPIHENPFRVGPTLSCHISLLPISTPQTKPCCSVSYREYACSTGWLNQISATNFWMAKPS